MNNIKKILYLHHGGAEGGAPISMLALMQALDSNKYAPVVGNATADPDVKTLFEAHGYKTFNCKIIPFQHTTGGAYNLYTINGWKIFLRWCKWYPQYKQNLLRLLKDLQPDLVHFNSLTLAPYACVPRALGIPCVVHVRETVLKGFWGARKRWLISHLERYADRVIAICHDNLDRLQLQSGKGVVVYNPVDLKRFNWKLSRQKARVALGIPADANTVLYAGGTKGLSSVKGLFQFLEAMAEVKDGIPGLLCLMPSFVFPLSPESRPKNLRKFIARNLGVYRQQDMLYALTRRRDLYRSVLALPFTYDMQNLMAAADVVCVPHMRPHFSRTVMEAGAMKKPVVAFRIGGVEEVVVDGVTGLMVTAGDSLGLACAIKKTLADEKLAQDLGLGGYLQALKLFDAKHSALAISLIYEDLLRR